MCVPMFNSVSEATVQSHFHLDYEENRKKLDLTHLTPLLDKTFNNKNIFSVDRLPQWPTTGDLWSSIAANLCSASRPG